MYPLLFHNLTIVRADRAEAILSLQLLFIAIYIPTGSHLSVAYHPLITVLCEGKRAYDPIYQLSETGIVHQTNDYITMLHNSSKNPLQPISRCFKGIEE